jgi:nucleotide-binding universal stress UspA family protein
LPFPYGKILCPIEFDSNSGEALVHAAAMAAHSGATLHLLHVVQVNPLAAQGASEGFAAQQFYDSQLREARIRLEEYAESIPALVKRELTVELGEPGSTIVAAQQRLGADLVVMATHGRRGLKHLVLGSVAERVVRESAAPVLTIRAPSHD